MDDRCALVPEAMFVDLRQKEIFTEALHKEFEAIEISSHEVIHNPKWEKFLTSCFGSRKLSPFGQQTRKTIFLLPKR
jgi:hypothetical protein